MASPVHGAWVKKKKEKVIENKLLPMNQFPYRHDIKKIEGKGKRRYNLVLMLLQELPELGCKQP